MNRFRIALSLLLVLAGLLVGVVTPWAAPYDSKPALKKYEDIILGNMKQLDKETDQLQSRMAMLHKLLQNGMKPTQLNTPTTIDTPVSSFTISEKKTKKTLPATRSSKDADETAKATAKESLSQNQIRSQIEESTIMLRNAVVQRNFATKALVQARKAGDASVARVHLRDALDRVERARSGTTAALSRLGAAAPPNPHKIQSLNIHPCEKKGCVYHLLQQMAPMQGSGQAQAFERGTESMPIKALLRPRVQKLLRGAREKSNQLSEDHADKILKPLEDALRDENPGFGKLTRPCRNGAQKCLSLAAAKMMDSPNKRAKLRQIGGVSLDVTFDLLDTIGIGGIGKEGVTHIIERPVIISLSRLYNAAKPYAQKGTWSELPQSLMYPGQMSRIYGFTLDPKRKDIWLIGAQSKDVDHWINIDLISIAIRMIWRDGETPMVSLDPRPDNVSGPQFTKVWGVPDDSIAARVMLDADYAMKKLTFAEGFEKGWDPINAYSIMKNMLKSDPSQCEGGNSSRFWLTPSRLQPHSIRLSPSGKSVLFQTSVMSQTEQLIGMNNQGTGRQYPSSKLIAQSFTENYKALEHAEKISPRGIYVRLHGFTDIVTITKMWRLYKVDYPVLNQWAHLPYLKLTGSKRVPSYYPGITVRHSFDECPLMIIGGVTMPLRRSGADVKQNASDNFAEIEHAVETAQSSRVFALATLKPVIFGGSPRIGENDIEALLLSARRSLGRGKLDAARRSFDDVLVKDPAIPEAWDGLAQVYRAKGKLKTAARMIQNALRYAPGDEQYKLRALDIAFRINPRQTYNTIDQQDKKLLSRFYTSEAYERIPANDYDNMRKFADWARQLDELNGYAHLAYALSFSVEHYKDRIHAFSRAIKALERQKKAGVENSERPLAIALLNDASTRLLRSESEILLQIQDTPEKSEFTLDISGYLYDMKRAHQEAKKALNLNQYAPLALGLSALIEISTASIAKDLEPSMSTEHGMIVLENAIKKYPDDIELLHDRARAFGILGQYHNALNDLNRVMELQPDNGRAYYEKALMLAGRKECEKAKVFFKKFLRRTPANHVAIASSRMNLALEDCSQ